MTRIEWVVNPDGKQGKTWNVVHGCSTVSEGCRNCYARRMARRLAGRYGYPEYPHHFDVTLRPDRLDIPLKRKKPTTYFVCSMSDLFHTDVPFWFIRSVWTTMTLCPQHTFQILTKRPKQMFQFVSREWPISLSVDEAKGKSWPTGTNASPILPNVWLGVTAENQAAADERIPLLLQTPAAVHFVSVEPMLGPVILHYWFKGLGRFYTSTALSWVICGGETGPGARPVDPDWVRSLRDQCTAAGVTFFFKSWGEWIHLSQLSPETRRYYCLGDTDDQGLLRPDIPTLLFPDGKIVKRVGKKDAGRLLDGRKWDEFPR